MDWSVVDDSLKEFIERHDIAYKEGRQQVEVWFLVGVGRADRQSRENLRCEQKRAAHLHRGQISDKVNRYWRKHARNQKMEKEHRALH